MNMDEYLNGNYRTNVTPDELPSGDTVYVASLVALPRCSAQGSSPEEALELLEENRRRMFRSRFERGVDIPAPDGEPVPGDSTTEAEGSVETSTYWGVGGATHRTSNDPGMAVA